METKTMNCIMCPMGCEMTVTFWQQLSPGSKICGNGSNRSPAHADNNRPDKRRTVAVAAGCFSGCAAKGKDCGLCGVSPECDTGSACKGGRNCCA